MARKPLSPEARRAKSRYAIKTRDLGRDHAETRAAQAEFRSEAYLAAVRAAVADAPPLSPEQRARLGAILRPVVQAAANTTEAAA